MPGALAPDAPVVMDVCDARRAFGGVQALDGACLQLRSGQWLGLLGPNGAGKTTLVNAIAGLVRLDSGTIHFSQGATRRAARSLLGVVPQTIALYPELSARENLLAFGRLHGVSGRLLRERVDWALAWTGLADRAAGRAGRFSGGMQRRLNIACGVLHRPSIVLLDEPTVGVDPQSRERIWQMLAALRDDGAALLLTTHQLDEAQQVCERIVIFDRGRVIADGTFAALVDQTVGRRRKLTVRLLASVDPASLQQRFLIRGDELRCDVVDVAGELPGLLELVRQAGGQIGDLRIEQPHLQAVFLHLTGRELRE